MRYAAKRIPAKSRLQAGKADRWSSLDVLGEALRWSDAAHMLHFVNLGMRSEPPIIVDGMTDDAEIPAWYDRLERVALAPDDSRPKMMIACQGGASAQQLAGDDASRRRLPAAGAQVGGAVDGHAAGRSPAVHARADPKARARAQADAERSSSALMKMAGACGRPPSAR